MRYGFGFLIALLLCTYSSRADEGKDRTLAYILTAVVPGSGLAYSGDIVGGVVMLGAHAATVVWIANSSQHSETKPSMIGGMLVFAMLRATDVGLTLKQLNRDLPKSVPQSLGVQFSYPLP